MSAGQYRHRIDIEQQVVAQDAITGELSTVWQAYVQNVPAEVLTGPGKEAVQADRKQPEIAARVRFRWFPGLDEAMRIVWDSVPFDIVDIVTDATSRREYRITLKGGLSDGR